MRTLLYLIWFAGPVIFLVMALFSKLEQLSGKARQGETHTYLRQGLFVFACALISWLIDQYLLEDLVQSYLDPFIPLILAQIILFPIILFAGSLLIGGSKPIQIQSKRPARRK